MKRKSKRETRGEFSPSLHSPVDLSEESLSNPTTESVPDSLRLLLAGPDPDGTAEWSSVDRLEEQNGAVTSASFPEQTPRVSKLLPLVVGLVGAGAVFGVGLTWFRDRMETELTSRTVTALATAGVPALDVSYVGRDAIVRVPSGTDVNQVRSVVLGATGPRVVVVKVDQSAPPASTTIATPIVTGDVTAVIQSDGTVTVAGTVSSIDAKLALVGGIKAQSPATIIVDNMTVVSSGIDARTATWVGKSIGELHRVGSLDAQVRGSVQGLAITGGVPTLAIRDAVNGYIAGSGLPVTGSFQIKPPSDLVIPDDGFVVPSDGTETGDSAPDTGIFGDPVESATSAQDQLNALLAASTIEFKPSSANLTNDGQRVVVEVSKVLLQNPSIRIAVVGHTDTNGNADSNVALSVARAQSVRDALVDLGVDAQRMTTEGVGGTKPLVPNDTPAQRKRNRRIELSVIPSP